MVRVSATLDDYVLDGAGERINHTATPRGETYLREYWTLGKRDGRWTLLSIEQDEEGEHQLDAPMEADPAEDARLTDRARVEAAVADALPAGVSPAEVDDDDAANALAKARDMSLADAALRPGHHRGARSAAGWRPGPRRSTATTPRSRTWPSRRCCRSCSTRRARAASLRLVVRAPVVRRVTLVDLDTEATPATATVHMELEGVRYVEDRNTLDARGGVEGPRHPLRRHLDAGARRLRRTRRGASPPCATTRRRPG